jgi:hypothetical protein
LLDPVSLIRSLAFAIIYGGIEYRYVNRREEGDRPAGSPYEFFEKPVFGHFAPYHVFMLFPLFVTAAFSLVLTAWVGNFFLIAVAEDIAYFGWRRSRVAAGEWTTRLFGSIGVGGVVVPLWWLFSFVLVALLYLVPF